MFRIVKPDVNIDFTGKIKMFGITSIILVIVSSILVFTKGLNYGIDFKGGTNIIYNFENTPDVPGMSYGIFQVFRIGICN